MVEEMDRVSLVHSVAKFLQCVDPWIWEDAVKLEVVKPPQLNVVVSLIIDIYFNGIKILASCLAWCVGTRQSLCLDMRSVTLSFF